MKHYFKKNPGADFGVFVFLALTLLILVPGSLSPFAFSQGQHEQPSNRAGHGTQEESEDIEAKRRQWFYHQRAYPLNFIPDGARLRALEQVDRMIADQPKLQRREQGQPATIAASAAEWTLIGPQPTSRGSYRTSGWTSALAVDPRNLDVVYFGSPGGGVWKTTDGGAHWVPLTDSQPSLAIGSIALDPLNPDTVYAGTGYFLYGAGILKSTDGGRNWVHLPGPFAGPFGSSSFFDGGAKIVSLAVHAANSQILLAGVFRWPVEFGGIYRSTDGGASWNLTLSGGSGTSVFFDPSGGNVAYAAIGEYYSDRKNGVYKSTDAGQTWSPINGTGVNSLDLPGSAAISLVQAASNPATMYVSITSASGGTKALFKTFDGGINWTRIGMPSLTRGIILAAHPTNSNVVFAGAESLYRSLDGGMTWVNVTGGANGKRIFGDIRSYAFSKDGARLYVGDDGGQWSTNDAASPNLSWTNLNDTPAITLFYPGLSIHPTDVNIGFGGSQDQGVQKYSGNLSWDGVVTCDGGWSAIDPMQPNIVYANCQGIGIFKSTSNGDANSWVRAENGIATSDRVSFIPPLVMDSSNPQRLYFGTFRLYQTNNGAGSWSAISPDLTKGASDTLSTIAVAPSDSNFVYAGSQNGRVQITTNASAGVAATWSDRTTGLPNRSVTQITVAPTDARVAYVTISGFTFGDDKQGHVFKTMDSGLSWVDISGNLPNIPANDIVLDPDLPGTFYLATDAGVFRTTNGGINWAPLGMGLPRVLIFGLKLHRPSRILRVATSGRSMWVFFVPNSPNNPVPALSSLSPSVANAGQGPFTLTINGNGFVPGAVVNWNGGERTTIYVNTTTLRASISANDVASSRSIEVRVFNPAPGGGNSNPLNFIVNNGVAIVSAASYNSSALASKAIVAAFGSNLATTTLAASTIPLPNSLAGTTVKVRDSAGTERLAPLFFVSPLQINYQIPAGTTTGAAAVTITNGNGIVSPGTMQIVTTGPALFTLNQSGFGAAAAQDAFTFAGPPFAATRASGEPNIIALYGTGLGADATDIDGNVNASTQVTIDGAPRAVLYAGGAPGFIGLNQFNVMLSVGITSGTHTLVVTRSGVQSNAVTIAIK